jgi:hypothetical protein
MEVILLESRSKSSHLGRRVILLGQVVKHSRPGEFQKNIDPPSKIADKGGRTISRCWCGRCGHVDGHSELLSSAKSGLGPTDSSVKLVLT